MLTYNCMISKVIRFFFVLLSIFADYFETVRYIVTHRIQSLGGRTKGQSEYDSANRISCRDLRITKTEILEIN